MSFGKLASVWPIWPFIISPGIAGMLWHWVHKCGLHQTLFITPKVIPSQRKWNTKAALAHSQSEGGWEDVFLTQPLPPSLFYYVVFRRGKNNVAMLCGDFAEWEFPAPAVWWQNSELGLDHFALGRASVQPTSRLCAVTLAQINKSVCLQSPATSAATVGGEVYKCSRQAASRIGNVPKSQLAFVWITMIDKKALQIASWNEIYPNDKFAQASFSSNCCPQRNLIHLCNKCTRWQDLPISEPAS